MTIEKTPITDNQLRALAAPLNPNRVAAKQGMSYLEAWDVKATLIKVFGFGGFSADLIESEILKAEQVAQVSNAQKTNWAITAKAVVRITIHQTGATYTEAAIAGSKQPDFTESADMAIKSAESDALKRAAIYLGTQFGLSLYNNGATNDVVKVVLSPDQQWPKPVEAPKAETPTAHGAQEQATTTGSAAPAPTEDGPNVLPLGEGLTDEQRAANRELLERGLRMKAEQQATEQPMALAGDTDE